MSDTIGDNRPAESPGAADAAAAVLSLTVDADNLYAMRAAVGAHGAQWGLTGPTLDRLLVVASELASNSIRHAAGTGRLRLWSDGDAVWCEVSDDGPGIADPDEVGTRPIPLTAEGGRGLWLCRQFCDGVTVVNRNPGCTVTVFLTIPATAPVSRDV
ncbi:ATP-binding protein [Dactylosporangium sp. CA-139114]|uniref:ATP-binding protein n=1 Tax=Dactylosporangium sp. CA-139114 TaxID=3239931 RepID=UPI003D97AC41